MSHTALIGFAPLTTLERINDPAWKRPGRMMCDAGALRFLPGETSVPLIVNHDDTRRIGTVRTLMRWDDRPAPVSSRRGHRRPARLADPERHQCSFGYKSGGRSQDVFGCEIQTRLRHRGQRARGNI
jgi:hypothetical protein